MKRIILLTCLSIFFMGVVAAQAQESYPVFSSALGGGGGAFRRSGVFRRGVVSGTRTVGVKKTRKAAPKKIVIRYEPTQTNLTDEQMETLMPLIQQIQAGEVRSLDVVAICRDYSTAYYRQSALGRMFRSYTPNLMPHFRQITGDAVITSNDNTMEFIAYH